MAFSLIWDLDGTLIDTYPGVNRALHRVLTDHGTGVTLREVEERCFVAVSTAISHWSEEYTIDAAELKEAYHEAKRAMRQCPPVMPGARELYEAAQASGGVNMMVTHAEAEHLALLDAAGLPMAAIAYPEAGFPRKPDPTMYHWVLEQTGVPANECLMVGDRPLDLIGAAAVGIPGIFLETPGHCLPWSGLEGREGMGHVVRVRSLHDALSYVTARG